MTSKILEPILEEAIILAGSSATVAGALPFMSYLKKQLEMEPASVIEYKRMQAEKQKENQNEEQKAIDQGMNYQPEENKEEKIAVLHHNNHDHIPMQEIVQQHDPRFIQEDRNRQQILRKYKGSNVFWNQEEADRYREQNPGDESEVLLFPEYSRLHREEQKRQVNAQRRQRMEEEERKFQEQQQEQQQEERPGRFAGVRQVVRDNLSRQFNQNYIQYISPALLTKLIVTGEIAYKTKQKLDQMVSDGKELTPKQKTYSDAFDKANLEAQQMYGLRRYFIYFDPQTEKFYSFAEPAN